MLRLTGYTLLMFALGAMLVLAAGAGQARTELAAARHPATMTALSASVKPAHPSLPSWVHWKTAPRGACRHGNGVIVWGGHGDGVLICASGETETP